MELQEIYEKTSAAVRELLTLDRDDLRETELLVVGCSSSEIAGGLIGHMSQPDYGRAVARAVLDTCGEFQVRVAYQCCEHLNRALVVEKDTARQYGLETVCVVPQPKAGGSCASAAYRLMKEPVVVEKIQADAGIDIGSTLIGMHLRPVAIPIRLAQKNIGSALVTAARTRPKLIGGPRAKYTLELDIGTGRDIR